MKGPRQRLEVVIHALSSAQLTALQIHKQNYSTDSDIIHTIPETDPEDYDADTETDSVTTQSVLDSDETYFDSDETYLDSDATQPYSLTANNITFDTTNNTPTCDSYSDTTPYLYSSPSPSPPRRRKKLTIKRSTT